MLQMMDMEETKKKFAYRRCAINTHLPNTAARPEFRGARCVIPRTQHDDTANKITKKGGAGVPYRLCAINSHFYRPARPLQLQGQQARHTTEAAQQ